jgi:hypothetical protein
MDHPMDHQMDHPMNHPMDHQMDHPMDLPEQIVYDFCHFLYDVYGKYEKVCIIAYKVRKENAWQTKIGLNQRGNFEVLIKKSSREKWASIS